MSLTKSYCVTKASVSCSPTHISRFSLTGPSCLGFILTNVGERSVWGSSALKSWAPLPQSPHADGSRCGWRSEEQHLTALAPFNTHRHTNQNKHNHVHNSAIYASAPLTVRRCEGHTLMQTDESSKTHSHSRNICCHACTNAHSRAHNQAIKYPGYCMSHTLKCKPSHLALTFKHMPGHGGVHQHAAKSSLSLRELAGEPGAGRDGEEDKGGNGEGDLSY